MYNDIDVININVKKLNEDAIIPSYAHLDDTGFDLYAVEDTFIKSNETAIVKTGLAFELPKGYGVVVRPRSGNTLKGVPNCIKMVKGDYYGDYYLCEERIKARVQIGTVDEGYRGEIGILTTNYEMDTIKIPKGTKLAQGVIERIPKATFTVVDEFITESSRGSNGYGSTDNK